MNPELVKKLKDRDLNETDFNRGLHDIEVFFDRQFNVQQTEWLYHQVKFLTKAEWTEVCEACRHRCEKLPTAKGIITIGLGKLRDAKERRMTFINFYYRQKGIPNCNYCDHTGILSAKIINNPLSQLYAYRCPFCDFANLLSLSREIPIWDEMLATHFTPTFRRKLDDKDKMWKDIYKSSGLKGINRAIRETPEKVWGELFDKF